MSPEFGYFIAFCVCLSAIHLSFENAPSVQEMLLLVVWNTMAGVTIGINMMVMEEIELYWHLTRNYSKLIPSVLGGAILSVVVAWYCSLNVYMATVSSIASIIIGFYGFSQNIRGHLELSLFEATILFFRLYDGDFNKPRYFAAIREPLLYQEIIKNEGNVNGFIFRLFCSTLFSKCFAINEEMSIFFIILYFMMPPMIGMAVYKMNAHAESAFFAVMVIHDVLWYLLTVGLL